MRNTNVKPTKRLAGRQWQRLIGLTGAFGSGKSTALALLKRRGAKTLDSDAIAHKLLEKDRAVRKKVLGAFGVLSRKDLASIVFANPAKRKRLERILHPLVEKKMKAELRKSKGALAVCDVPLLFEAGWTNRFDKVLYVHAPFRARAARLRKRGFTGRDVRARSRAQWPVNRKKEAADIVVQNGGSLTDLKKRIKNLTF